MNLEDIQLAEDLAERHWEFIDSLLQLTENTEIYEDRSLKRYLYVSAFEHGYKHGREDAV